MAQAPAAPTGHASTDHQAPITPGKVAMWLFLATEVMFFTGLIGSYIVLRTGSPPTAYSNLHPPATVLTRLMDTEGVRLLEAGAHEHEVAAIIAKAAKIDEETAHHLTESAPHLVTGGMTPADARKVTSDLTSAGARVELEELKTYNWPRPYDHETNPLSIDLTAVNTFILICSSVTMVLALSAIQRGDKKTLTLYLLATVLIGGTFLGVQVYEYYQLMFGHHYPVGISKTSHFRPSSSLFASAFFTMTGFHGAHVAGGVIMLTTLFIGSLMGRFTRENHAAVEMVGLYWHFVDLVWIILFTVVYLI